jgi:hypothetical protein
MSLMASRRTSLRLVLVQASIAVMLAACGGGGDDDAGAATEAEQQTGTAAAAGMAPSQPAGGPRRAPICMHGSMDCPGGPITQ